MNFIKKKKSIKRVEIIPANSEELLKISSKSPKNSITPKLKTPKNELEIKAVQSDSKGAKPKQKEIKNNKKPLKKKENF